MNLLTFTFLLLLILPTLVLVTSFATSKRATPASTLSKLQMVPKYDPLTQRWTPSSEEESAANNYPVINSLLRHGPKAFISRITQPDMYDQAVMKFMAKDNVERWVAQGNMDRFNENAQDWAFERMEMERMGKTYDYVTLKPKQVILSSIWAGVVFWFANDLFQRYGVPYL